MKILGLVLLVAFFKSSFETPLDDYVNTPDPHYKYDHIHTYELTGYKLYILNMTSQKWQDGNSIVIFQSFFENYNFF